MYTKTNFAQFAQRKALAPFWLLLSLSCVFSSDEKNYMNKSVLHRVTQCRHSLRPEPLKPFHAILHILFDSS